jgi:hypothetical protein
MADTRHVSSPPAAAPAVTGRACLPSSTRARAAWLLSGITVALLLVASVAGLLVDGLYRDAASTSSMLRGYDLVTLVVVVPALAVGLSRARHGSVRALLVWLGMLAATVYTYAYYLFLPAFNDLFLVHVAVFSSALFALVFALSAIDARAIAARFGPRTPRRSISGFLALLAAVLGGMWVYYSLRFAFTDEPPVGSVLVETDALVHLGFVLDLAVLVPAYALAVVLLWRGAAWGYVLAAVAVISGTVHQIEYLVALPFQVNAGVPDATAFDPGEPPIVIAFLVAAVVLLANVVNRPVSRQLEET